MNPLTKRILQSIITFLVIITCFIYLYIHRSDLKLFEKLNATQVVLLIILILAYTWITGYIFKRIALLIEIRLSMMETFGLSILTNFGNYLGPTRPGAALKAVYLKAAKKLPYSKFVSILSASSFLLLFMMGLIGLTLLLLLEGMPSQFKMIMLIIFAGIVVFSSLPFFIRLPDIKATGRISNIMNNALEGFTIISNQKKEILYICFLYVIQFAMGALVCWFIYSSLGVSITFMEALAIGVIGSICNFFTITPNNIGIQETFMAYTFTITGSDFSTGVIGAALGRMIHIIITFVLTPFFVHYLLNSKGLQLREILKNKSTSINNS